MNKYKYKMIIQWSNIDNCYLLGLPDFPGQEWRTHGDTYQEAVNNGLEVLDLLIEDYQLANEELPKPSILDDKVARSIETIAFILYHLIYFHFVKIFQA